MASISRSQLVQLPVQRPRAIEQCKSKSDWIGGKHNKHHLSSGGSQSEVPPFASRVSYFHLPSFFFFTFYHREAVAIHVHVHPPSCLHSTTYSPRLSGSKLWKYLQFKQSKLLIGQLGAVTVATASILFASSCIAI